METTSSVCFAPRSIFAATPTKTRHDHTSSTKFASCLLILPTRAGRFATTTDIVIEEATEHEDAALMEAQLREIAAVLTAFVAILFLYAGIAKILSLRPFRRDLLLIPYLPRGLSRPLGVAIPLAEVVTGGCLLLGVEWAIVTAIALLTMFSTVALVAHSRNQKVPCNCFGVDSSEQLSLATVVRNAVLACMTASSFFFAGSQSPSLAKSYGLIAFVLFLCVNTAVKNGREFREALSWRLLA